MDVPARVSANRRLFIVSSFVLGSVLLSTAALSMGARPKHQRNSLPKLEDETGSFRLVSMERITEQFFVMRVQNISPKVITAYGDAVCNVPESSTDYTLGDFSIAPGEVVEQLMAVKVLSDNCDPDVTQPTVTINAVIFDDRTYAGESRFATGILEGRRGEKIQLQRINVLLTKALKSPDAGEVTAIDRLEAQIAALPIDAETLAVRGGLSTAKQRASHLLEELRQWRQSGLTTQAARDTQLRGELAGISNLKGGLERLISLNEKWISRY